VNAAIVPSFPRLYREHLSIVEATATQRIPTMYEWGEIARDGGLIADGPVSGSSIGASHLTSTGFSMAPSPGTFRSSSRPNSGS
jgi:hypothetical protein